MDELDAHEPKRVWIQIIRERSGGVKQVQVHKCTNDSPPSAPAGEDNCDTFQYTLPRDAHPYMDIAVAVPLRHVELKGSFGEVCAARDDVPEDLGGVIQVWYYKDKSSWTQEYDIELRDSPGSPDPPVLLYEHKVSQEIIDVLTFSSDSTLRLAATTILRTSSARRPLMILSKCGRQPTTLRRPKAKHKRKLSSPSGCVLATLVISSTWIGASKM